MEKYNLNGLILKNISLNGKIIQIFHTKIRYFYEKLVTFLHFENQLIFGQ